MLVAMGKYVASEQCMPKEPSDITEVERMKLVNFAIAEGITFEQANHAFSEEGSSQITNIIGN
mgnify:CR=1 FL=1